MKKRVLSLFVAVVMMLTTLNCLPFDSLKAKAVTIKDLYTIGDSSALTVAGITRASKMDRQCLGFILPAGSSIKIKQTNTNFGKDIKIQLLNDGSITSYQGRGTTETAFNIPADGTEIVVANTAVTAGLSAPVSVPFILTPIEASNGAVPQITYTVVGSTQTLPYYKDGLTDQKEFLETWTSTKAPFAVLESDEVQILTPVSDIAHITKIVNADSSSEFKSLREVFKFYKDMIVMYDGFIGLSDTATEPWNKNVHTKWFIKCDKISNLGAAYYDSGHTVASSRDSLGSGFYVRDWTILHEFAHGYQGGMFSGDGTGMYFGEVWNNLYADMYQRTYSTELWAFNKKNRAEYDTKMYTYRQNGTSFDDIGLREKLLVMVLLRETIGMDAFTHMSQEYRKQSYENKSAIKPNTVDFLAKYLSEGSGYNLAPYFSAYGEDTTGLNTDLIYATDYKGLYFLSDFVTNAADLESLRVKYGLPSIHSVIPTEKLKDDGIKGSATINFTIDDINNIKGKTLKIRDGSRVVYTTTVNSATVSIPDIPVGMYTIDFPYAGGFSYEVSGSRDLVIKQNSTTSATLKFIKPTNNGLSDDRYISFHGISDSVFATAKMDLNTKKMTISTISKEPHYFYEDELYSSIKVKNTSGTEVYNQSWIGRSTAGTNTTGDSICDIDYGYTIEVFHDEAKSRLKVRSELTGKEDTINTTTTKSTVYEVTEFGLKKKDGSTTTAEADALVNMSNTAAYIRDLTSSSVLANPAELQNLRYKMMGTILQMPASNQAGLIKTYNDILLVDSDDDVSISIASEVTLTEGTAKDIPYTTSANSPTVTATEALPTGITLDTVNKKLVVSSSAAVGTHTITLKAAGASKTATATVKIVIEGQPVSISMESEVVVVKGTAKNIPYTTSENSPTVTATETLPAGITLDTVNKRLVVSSSTQEGTYTVTLRAAGTSKTATATVKIIVEADPVSISIASEVSVPQGSAKDIPYTTSENSPTVTATTTLPTGITLDTVNKKLVVSSSAAVGTHTVTLKATGASKTATATVVITVVAEVVTISMQDSAVIMQGVATNIPYTISENSPTVTAATTLPTGITLDEAGKKLVISNSVAKGTYIITLKAAGKFANASATITIVIVNSTPSISQYGDVIIPIDSSVNDIYSKFKASDPADNVADFTISKGVVDYKTEGIYEITLRATIAQTGQYVETPVSVEVVASQNYAGDMTMSKATTEWRTITADKNSEYGTPLQLIDGDGKTVTYDKGISAHAKSEIEYDLTSLDYTHFRSYLGIDMHGGHFNSTAVFTIYLDGAEVYNSGLMKRATAKKLVDIPLDSASTLRLVVDDYGDGNGGDHGNWADAMFVKRTQEESVVGEAVFKVGSDVAYHTVHGVEEVDPIFIKDGRAFVAIRQAAQAVGVAQDDIVYAVDSNGKETVELAFRYKDNGVRTGYKVKFTEGSRDIVFTSLDGNTEILKDKIPDDTQVMRYSEKNPNKLYLPARVLSQATSIGGAASYVHIEYCANSDASTSNGQGDFVCYAKADDESHNSDLKALIEEAVNAFSKPKQ